MLLFQVPPLEALPVLAKSQIRDERFDGLSRTKAPRKKLKAQTIASGLRLSGTVRIFAARIARIVAAGIARIVATAEIARIVSTAERLGV